MNRNYTYNLCRRQKWGEVRGEYLASDASNEDKKKQICYRSCRRFNTFLFWAFRPSTPEDIIQSLLGIGGKELVMITDCTNGTVLHSCCCNYGTSPDVIKMVLIDVGGKELVMAKDSNGYIALHHIIFISSFVGCFYKTADTIKLILEAADTEEILQTKNNACKTPLEMATAEKVPDEIENLLSLPNSSTSDLNNDKPTPERSNRQRR